MRLKLFMTISTFIIFFVLLPTPVHAKERLTSSTELIENAKQLDNTIVSYQGEVIGDILYHGKYAWINVSDGTNAIGVFVPSSEAQKIKYVGRYRITGDTILFSGTFHRACANHGGDMDIHANTIQILKKGHLTSDNPSSGLVLLSAVLFLCALFGIIFTIRKIR